MTQNEMVAFIKKQRAAIIASIDDTGCPNENAMFRKQVYTFFTEGLLVVLV